MGDKKFVVMESWIDAAADVLEGQEMWEFCYGLMIYGLYGDMIETSNKAVKMALNMVYPQIDKMGAAYDKKVAASQIGGDVRAKLDSGRIWGLAHNEGLSGTKIKEILESELGFEISNSTLYHNRGWIERKNDNPDFCQKEILEKNVAKTNENCQKENLAESGNFQNCQMEKEEKNIAKWQF